MLNGLSLLTTGQHFALLERKILRLPSSVF